MRKSWVLGCPIFRQPIFHALVCWRLQHTWTNGPNQITVHNSDMWTHIISHHISQAFRSCPPSLKHWYTLTTYIYIYISGYVKPLAIQVAGSSCFIPESHGSVWPMKHCITQWTWTFVSLATIKNEHCHCVLTFRWIVAHVWPFIFPLQGCSSRFLNWICPQSP